MPRIGKTASTLAELPEPFLFLCRDVSNPTVKKLPHVQDTEAGLEYALTHPTKTMAIRCFNHNRNILDVCKDRRRAVCLDEVGNLFFDARMMDDLVIYMREVGYCDGGLRVWATSQRASADVRPAVYRACRVIKWVGPLFSELDSKTLYGHRSYNIEFDEFCGKLRNLKPYNWKNPNVAESILTVKDI